MNKSKTSLNFYLDISFKGSVLPDIALVYWVFVIFCVVPSTMQCVTVYLYIYICIYICIYMYIYIVYLNNLLCPLLIFIL